ncbi:MAG: hypothetical protein HYX87_00840 [Chloroflexi bacterium]|nr:hypothetical protein [Chloroflexota bacterium]
MNAPQGFVEALGKLPAGVELKTGDKGPFDLVLAFVSTRAEVDSRAPEAIRAMKPGGALWFAYPKKTSAIKTDISRDAGWSALQAAGYRPVSLFAIDDTWAALRFRPVAEVKR